MIHLYGSTIVNKGDHQLALFLMEFCHGGSLFDLMEKYNKEHLSQAQIIFILKEILTGN